MSPSRWKRLALPIAPLLVIVLGARVSARQDLAPADPAGPNRPAGENLMEARWADLEKGEPAASHALLALADRPKLSVAFLKRKMKPLTIDAGRVKALLAELGSDDEGTWKGAFEELEYFDPRLAIGLEALMADVRDAPARQRMVEVLSGREAGSLAGKEVDLRAFDDGHNFFSKPGGSWWAEVKVSRVNATPWGNTKKKWTRAVRAIAFLEHVGTPEAVAIVEGMATGHEEAQPTIEAKKALERLADKAR